MPQVNDMAVGEVQPPRGGHVKARDVRIWTRVIAGGVVCAFSLVAPAARDLGGVAFGQTAPPPVVTASAHTGVLISDHHCDGTVANSLHPGSVTVARTGDLSASIFVDVTWGGSLDQSLYSPPAGLTIPAGSTSATFQIASGTSLGTVSIVIADTTNPGTFTVGSPSTAQALILQEVSDEVCPTVAPTSLTTQPQAPPATLPATPATPIDSSPHLTG